MTTIVDYKCDETVEPPWPWPYLGAKLNFLSTRFGGHGMRGR
jgi:hypothetical protein